MRLQILNRAPRSPPPFPPPPSQKKIKKNPGRTTPSTPQLYKRQAQITLLALLRVPGILQAWLPPPARSAPGPAPPLKRGFFTKAAQQQKAAPPGEDATQCLAELVQAMIRL